MEILLIACMFAWAAGAQSEQARLGVSPAQRAVMREQTRHEKAVRKIAEKHGGAKIPVSGVVSPWKDPPGETVASAPTLPAAFMSGWREHRPEGPPLGHRVGARAGQGVSWAQGTARDAWRAFRERQQREGHDGPEFVSVPLPPDYPPAVPPIPATPPPVTAVPEKPNAPPDSATEPATDKPVEAVAKPTEPAVETTPPKTAETPPEAPPVVDEKPEPEAGPEAEQPTATAPPEPPPTDAPEGVGRMAAEVTYESVKEESDEMSLMCETDGLAYNRIRDRAEREIGRSDTMIVQLRDAGFGDKVIGWVIRCKEQYEVIRAQVDQLQQNTVIQGERAVSAKELLEAGQGLYAAIAKDQEAVAERESYVSDAVDAEDVNAEAEVYETKAVA